VIAREEASMAKFLSTAGVRHNGEMHVSGGPAVQGDAPSPDLQAVVSRSTIRNRPWVLVGVVIIFVGVAVEGSALVLLEIMAAAPTTPGPPTGWFIVLLQIRNAAPIIFGTGFFLAAFGLASPAPSWNRKILAGGLLVLIGSSGAASLIIYQYYLIFGGGGFSGLGSSNIPGVLMAAFSLLSSIGTGVFLLGFLTRRASLITA
jgi:hypothetical protein